MENKREKKWEMGCCKDVGLRSLREELCETPVLSEIGDFRMLAGSGLGSSLRCHLRFPFAVGFSKNSSLGLVRYTLQTSKVWPSLFRESLKYAGCLTV